VVILPSVFSPTHRPPELGKGDRLEYYPYVRDSSVVSIHWLHKTPRHVALALAVLASSERVLSQARAPSELAAKSSPSLPGAQKPGPLRSDPKAEEKLLAAVGQGFRLHRTSHFVVACDVSSAPLSQLLSRRDATYYRVHAFCRVRHIPIDVSCSKLEIVFFDDRTAYAKWARRFGVDPSGSYGFYDQRTNHSAFYNLENDPEFAKLRVQLAKSKANVEHVERVLAGLPANVDRVHLTYNDGRVATMSRNEAHAALEANRRSLRRLSSKLIQYAERLNQSVIQHEAAHHIFFAGGVLTRMADNPSWLVEGLACQFEVPVSYVGDVQNSISQYRLAEFHEAASQKLLLPLERVLWDGEFLVRNTPNRGIFYAQAWGLVYYLKNRFSDRFAAYVRALAARRPGESVAHEQEQAEYRRFFGQLDEAFVRRWEKHILALPYRPEEVKP